MDKAPGETNKGRFRVDNLDVDLDRQSVQRDGERIELPDLSFRLFAVLVARAPHHVSKDDLIREVWGNVVVGDETLAQRVRLLRQALGEDGQNPRYVSSVRGRGYRLICDVATQASTRRKMPAKWALAVSLAVILLSAAVMLFRAGSMDALSPITTVEASSIAVLPFTDLSPRGTTAISPMACTRNC